MSPLIALKMLMINNSLGKVCAAYTVSDLSKWKFPACFNLCVSCWSLCACLQILWNPKGQLEAPGKWEGFRGCGIYHREVTMPLSWGT